MRSMGLCAAAADHSVIKGFGKAGEEDSSRIDRGSRRRARLGYRKSRSVGK